ncbi:MULTISPECIES: hypothetical protein [Aerococcus]|nr:MULTISPECIES: hypothetical protein [Aerococcus]MDK8132651.1 hypothetical protein [Aerococcus urinae]MDK8484429.1 hypothetical protein [Aerococcus urinae]MDL5179288.1 hypothetical protein [Aerococcus tenax]MDL5208189.1 hypothetical protein [Aerococcus tenax]WIW73332.1 hypothetical protein DBT50_001435 [Aerococcus tenax]
MSTYSYPARMPKAILIKISYFLDRHKNLPVKQNTWISGERISR